MNPPIDEELIECNSFPGNLPRRLEREKLIRLTETIEANFGCRPLLYRAGRYGFGPHTAELLAEIGYEIDCSVLPFTDLSGKGGPDSFCRSPACGRRRRAGKGRGPAATPARGVHALSKQDLFMKSSFPDRLHVPVLVLGTGIAGLTTAVLVLLSQ